MSLYSRRLLVSLDRLHGLLLERLGVEGFGNIRKSMRSANSPLGRSNQEQTIPLTKFLFKVCSSSSNSNSIPVHSIGIYHSLSIYINRVHPHGIFAHYLLYPSKNVRDSSKTFGPLSRSEFHNLMWGNFMIIDG